MSTRPTLADLPKFPVVGGTMGLAIGVTIARLMEVDVSALYCDPPARFGEPWRLVTSALPHVNVMHLVFNVMMMWGFGWYVEAAFGHLRTLGLVVLFAAGSAAGEYAFLEGGIGLSGVLYGLFGMLLVLSRFDPRHRGIIPSRTAWTLTIWFFACIVLTYARIMPIANIAHGVGWLLGSLVGWAIARPRWRWPTAAVTAAVTAALLLLAVVYRPRVNFRDPPGHDERWMAQRAIDRGDIAAGEAWAARAVAANPADPKLHEYLGLARGQLAWKAMEAKDDATAERWFRRAIEAWPEETTFWHNLGFVLHRQGRTQDADAAFEKEAEILATRQHQQQQQQPTAPPATQEGRPADGTD